MRLCSLFNTFLFNIFLLAAATTLYSQDNSDLAIRQLIQRYVDVRNHMDEKTLRGLLTPDADQLVSSGQWRHGVEDLVKGAAASSRKENGRSSVTLETVRLLGPDTAIADGRYETTSSPDAGSRKMWSCFILKRVSGEWRIAAIRNMLPAAP